MNINIGSEDCELYVGESSGLPIIPLDSPIPSGTVLHKFDRVDGKATVAGFFTDGNGQRYAVCLPDARFRTYDSTTARGIIWSTDTSTDTPLTNYASLDELTYAQESGTYNTNLFIQTYPSQLISRNAFYIATEGYCKASVIVDGKTFNSCLPNLPEIRILYPIIGQLDELDPTAEGVGIRVSSIYGAFSSNEYDSGKVWCVANLATGRPTWLAREKNNGNVRGVVSMIEIPVDENGVVLNEDSHSDIPTTLGSRLDNKATVVGVLQDHEGNDYVLAVVDAIYRSGSQITRFPRGASSLPVYRFESDALNDHHSGKYNTDVLLAETSSVTTDALGFATNACNITLNNTQYTSVIPSLFELKTLYESKNVLDQYDPTVNNYQERSMMNFTFGANGSWSCIMRSTGSSAIWGIGSDGKYGANDYRSSWASLGVCPVFCIPLT